MRLLPATLISAPPYNERAPKDLLCRMLPFRCPALTRGVFFSFSAAHDFFFFVVGPSCDSPRNLYPSVPVFFLSPSFPQDVPQTSTPHDYPSYSFFVPIFPPNFSPECRPFSFSSRSRLPDDFIDLQGIPPYPMYRATLIDLYLLPADTFPSHRTLYVLIPQRRFPLSLGREPSSQPSPSPSPMEERFEEPVLANAVDSAPLMRAFPLEPQTQPIGPQRIDPFPLTHPLHRTRLFSPPS